MCQFTLESSGTIYLLEVSPNFTLHVMYMHSQDVRHLCWNLRGARAVWVEQERKGSSDQPLSFVVESFFFFPSIPPDLWKDLPISWGGTEGVM